VSPAEFAAVEESAILVRRFDGSRWRVLRKTIEPRLDRGSQHMLGPLVYLTLRRISPELKTACEPLTWEAFAVDEDEEVA
jgi:hypothetical protein